jgi:hypothetical protein
LAEVTVVGGFREEVVAGLLDPARLEEVLQVILRSVDIVM